MMVCNEYEFMNWYFECSIFLPPIILPSNYSFLPIIPSFQLFLPSNYSFLPIIPSFQLFTLPENKALDLVLQDIDDINMTDTRFEVSSTGKQVPQEFLYGMRMTLRLFAFTSSTSLTKDQLSPVIQIAARAQHIARWRVPRTDYPLGLKG